MNIGGYFNKATPKLQSKLSPKASHPFYPLEVEIAGYLANDYPWYQLLAGFSAACTVLLGTTTLLARRIRPQITTTELVTCGTIHLFFEGYYVYNYEHVAGLRTILGQLWKEYALSDSRYLTQDPFVLCMEAITAFIWGPLSYAVAATIIWDHELRYPLQLIVSLGQLYGDVLYYATNTFNHYFYHVSYSRPEAFYYWGYYVAVNFLWIVMPMTLIVGSVRATGSAFNGMNRVSQSLKNSGLNANGTAKKTQNGEAKKSK
ncbi:MAG: hypothetical protein M1831_000994 [Alyxoria varia]|nr:MAG: hypothetical protein M1831_000994 [Alyxoria varia]